MVENIGYIFMYEFINWVNYQITTGTFNVKLNRIEAYAPGVLRLESPIKITNKAVLELEENYKMLCNLSLIDAEYFSAKMIKIGKKKVEETKKQIIYFTNIYSYILLQQSTQEEISSCVATFFTIGGDTDVHQQLENSR